jgi:hypothetical protein
MDTYVTDYLAKSDENFALYEFLKDSNKFDGWQLVAIFYSALCIAKAYLYNKKFPKNSINSHDSIKNWLASETEAKRLNVLYYYESLYRDSRDARYSTKKISKARISKALENYEVVKKLLVIE